MRVLMLLAMMALLTRPVRAQLPVVDSSAVSLYSGDPSDEEDFNAADHDEQDAFAALLRGSQLYEQGRFGRAIRPLQQAFSASPSEDAASALYYSLLYTGQSLEAQAFRDAHPDFTYALPPSRFRLEYGYAEGGIKMPVEPTAINLFYGGGGAGFRFASPLRLRQHFYYWRQPGGELNYHQLESRTGLEWYLGRSWLLLPAVHYIYQPFRTDSSISRPVLYAADYRDGADVYRYRTSALQQLDTRSSGSNHFAGFSLGLQKRFGSVELGIAPALQYLPGSYHYQYTYASSGHTDSSFNGTFLGSAPFQESGSGSGDSAYKRWIFQLGTSLGWRPPLRRSWLYLRIAAYGLRDNKAYSVGAADFYSLLQLKPILWLHLSALYKSGLPLLTGGESVYLNYNSRVARRFGGTLQLWPLRHFSPSLTYQFEELRNDRGAFPYHSVYLTFSYQP